MNNEFNITFGDYNYFYKDFDDDVRLAFLRNDIYVNSVYEPFDKKLNKVVSFSDKELVDMFEYINFLGTPQDEEHLLKLKQSIK